MLDPQKTREREALLKRNREIRAELAQIERNIRELEARLPIEEQLSLKLAKVHRGQHSRAGGKGSGELRLLTRIQNLL